MDLNRLSEFLMITEEKSFKKAAEKLRLSPNVLSTRFHTFEQSLNTELLRQGTGGMEVTPQGAILLKYAKELLDQYDNILLSMKHISNTSFQSLRIMLCAQTMPPELLVFLEEYSRKFPHMFLGLYDENSCFLQEGLKSGEIDIAFAVGRKADFTGISGKEVLIHYPKIKICVPEDHPLAEKPEVCFKDLNNETFILYPQMKESFIRDLQLSILQQSGISYQIYEDHQSPFFYELLVPINKGIRFWNWSNQVLPGTVQLTVTDPGYDLYLYLLYNVEHENPATSRFIRDYLSFREEWK